MMLMSTYGTLTRMGENKKRHYSENGVKMMKELKYPEVIYNHYSYCDMIDNHNSSRMHPISMEETWMMIHWANHVFCFLLAVTVMNIQKGGLLLRQQVKNGCTAISSSYCKTVYIQLSFGARTSFQETSKMRNNSSHTHHGSDTQKIHPRATCDLQDKIWKVEVQRLFKICSQLLFLHSWIDGLH